MLHVWKGRTNAQWANHAYVWSNVSSHRLCLDRSVRLSSLTRKGCLFASSFAYGHYRLVCSQSVAEIGVI